MKTLLQIVLYTYCINHWVQWLWLNWLNSNQWWLDSEDGLVAYTCRVIQWPVQTDMMTCSNSSCPLQSIFSLLNICIHEHTGLCLWYQDIKWFWSKTFTQVGVKNKPLCTYFEGKKNSKENKPKLIFLYHAIGSMFSLFPWAASSPVLFISQSKFHVTGKHGV